MRNLNWQNIVFFLVVFGLPALSWLANKIKEQSQERRLRAQRERLRMEQLRQAPTVSQRSGGGPDPAALTPLQVDDEARRRAELEALRRRRLAELQAQAVRTAQRGARPQRPPFPTRLPRSQRMASSLGRAAGAGGRSAASPTSPAPSPRSKGAAAAPGHRPWAVRSKAPAPQRAQAAEQAVRRASAAPPSPSRQAKRRTVSRGVLGNLSRKELRRAVILKEIFDPPVALRDHLDLAG